MTKPISTSFSGAISVIETKIAALEKASNLAAEVLEVRLHSMNEFRTQLKTRLPPLYGGKNMNMNMLSYRARFRTYRLSHPTAARTWGLYVCLSVR